MFAGTIKSFFRGRGEINSHYGFFSFPHCYSFDLRFVFLIEQKHFVQHGLQKDRLAHLSLLFPEFHQASSVCMIKMKQLGPGAKFWGTTFRDLFFSAKTRSLKHLQLWIMLINMLLVSKVMKSRPGDAASELETQLQAAAIGLFHAALPRDPPAFFILPNPFHFIIFPLTIRSLDSLLCSSYNYFCLFRQSSASKHRWNKNSTLTQCGMLFLHHDL